MKGFYRMLNVECWRMLKGAGVIGLVLIIAQWFIFLSAMKGINEYSVIPRFEDVYAASGNTVLFWAGLIAVLTWFTISFYAHYWGSKSIYTLLTLPVDRNSLHASKFISLLFAIALLLCAQLLSTSFAFHMFENRLESFEEPYIMVNGQFLAFIRSGFLRLLFPLSLEGVLHSIVLWFAMAALVYYAVLCERSHKYWGILPAAAAAYCMFKLVQLRTAYPVSLPYESMTDDTYYSVILLLLSVYFIWHGLRWIKRGAIV